MFDSSSVGSSCSSSSRSNGRNGSNDSNSNQLLCRPRQSQRTKKSCSQKKKTSSKEAAPTTEASRAERLIEVLLSSRVQAKPSSELSEEPAKLTDAQVQAVFTSHVPKVKDFLFRGKEGQPSLKFMVSAYRSGLQAFRGTELELHLTWCMRYVVHQGHAKRPDVRRHLIEVAEAFTECQAVQARAIEKAALAMLGMAPDFREAVVKLVGDYKSLALKILAYDRVSKGLARDFDAVPTHYENRLTADLGPLIGAHSEDIRRASLDGHAASRFPKLVGVEAEAVAARCRELFDLDAVLQVFVGEVNSFSEKSEEASLASLFVRWLSSGSGVADAHKHALLDEETLSRPQIDANVALAAFEKVFLGTVDARETGSFHGVPLRAIFGDLQVEGEAVDACDADGEASTAGTDRSGRLSLEFFSAQSESASERGRAASASSVSAKSEQDLELNFQDLEDSEEQNPGKCSESRVQGSPQPMLGETSPMGEKRRKTSRADIEIAA